MDKFLDAHNQPKLNQKDIKHLNNLITRHEIEAIIKKCESTPYIAILISTSKNPWSFLLLLILSLQQN
jgi:hypothetical protein